ncbi:WW domain-containing oxidoreductase [Condylostylus longicornis]|uniref:WW domain-containing oxidoreductase n=1 Tax=Condylostylus longicornis TaxID=2530218 RepID=UPI00244E1C9A|nr:WW domain-containing oxidoreductase [Condylostylus longicornis]
MPTYLADSDSEDELPPDWEERATDDGFVFYVSHYEKRSQWTHPRTGKSKRVTGDLPIDWEKQIDQESKKTIFFNKKTNQVTYNDPRLAFAVEGHPTNISEVRQRYDSSSTALQVLHGKDLNGKVAVITGANVGIGFQTARAFALHGADVVFACRNQQSAEDAILKISEEKPSAGRKCRFVRLDLSSLKSVRNFARELKETFRHVSYLILNAGVFALPYTVTEDGLEATFQICHISHYFLTQEVESLLDHASRVIVVSSESHRFANLPTDNLTEQILSPPQNKYNWMMAYNNVKLCNVLFARELAKRLQNRFISVFVLHPGNMVSSDLARNWWLMRILFAIVRPFTKSLEQASSTTVYCATATELFGLTGLYFNNCFFCEPSKLAQNDNLAEQLWTLSETICNRIINEKVNEGTF